MRHLILVVLVATAGTGCVAPVMRSTLTTTPTPHQMAELWEDPTDLATRNLFDGPWGRELAPTQAATYTFVEAKTAGVSPGFTVTDAAGVEWSVKQGAEAQVEVVMSRILSAVGYRQPPVYYLPAWTISGGPTPGAQPEGRFRPKHPTLKSQGDWSWHENPFVGTRPFDGLRALMMILGESDLKTSNNTLYEVSEPGGGMPTHWFVVRDIGMALGETGRFGPKRNDIEKFEEAGFIKRAGKNEVHFKYYGRHQELANHISANDVRWMSDLLARLTPNQWRDAFRAGGYETPLADRFIAQIKQRIAAGQALAPSTSSVAPEPIRPGSVATNHQLRRKYIWSTLGLDGAIHATWSSGFSQWRGSPEEWDSSKSGYAQRWTSAFAKSAIGNTATYGVARLLHHDPAFTRCECTGTGPRLGNAALSPFVARNREGDRVFSPATLTGLVTGQVARDRLWYPAPRGMRDEVNQAVIGIAGKIGMSLVREFWPRRGGK